MSLQTYLALGTMYTRITVVNNPLAQHYLTILRNKNTKPMAFRETLRRLGFILGYEAAKYLKWSRVFIETPLARTEGVKPSKPLLIVGVLGASIPLIEGIWEALPWAGLGLVAARRRENLTDSIEVDIYYQRLPDDLSPFTIILADPMLATGKTLVSVIKKLKLRGARDIVVTTVISSKQGINYLMSNAGEPPLITIAIDPILDSKYFIVPGLGDAGDRGLGYDLY